MRIAFATSPKDVFERYLEEPHSTDSNLCRWTGMGVPVVDAPPTWPALPEPLVPGP